MKKITEQFNAVDESGERIVIQIWQKVIDTSNMREGHSTALGKLKEAIAADGRELNYVDATTFAVVATGELLRVTQAA